MVKVEHGFYPSSLLLLHGTADRQAPACISRQLYDVLRPHYQADSSRLKLLEFPGAGHRPTAEMAQAVKEWFQRRLLQAFLPADIP